MKYITIEEGTATNAPRRQKSDVLLVIVCSKEFLVRVKMTRDFAPPRLRVKEIEHAFLSRESEKSFARWN